MRAMNYDGFTLAAVAAELKHTLTGARVQKVRQHNATDITLEVRGAGHTYLLFFSVDARFSRVYLTASSQPVPQEPPNFCMVLRKYISGAFITGIEQVEMDRILEFHLESGDNIKRTLIFELMGKHSNLILVDDNGQITGAIKHVGTSISRYRQVLPGKEYLPPPGSEKVDPRTVDSGVFDRLWSFGDNAPSDNAKKWLMSTLSGFGPFLADEMTVRCSEGGVVSRDKVKEELLDLRDMIISSRYLPVFITNERGEGQMVYPMPSVQFPTSQQHTRASIDEALDALFRTLVTRTQLEEERAQVVTAIRRAMASRKQTLKSIQRTIEESEKADTYRQTGELLLANLHVIEKGVRSVTLTDYFDPELAEREIELDEKLTPQQNAERYFKRYQKSRDAVSTALTRQSHVEREIGLLESGLSDAEQAKSVEALKSLRKSLTDQDLLRAEVAPEKQGEAEFEGHRIRRVFTPEGWEILYGESSTSNDYLTQRIARPNDVWLHARSITGAHVVIRTAGHKGGVPRPVLEMASRIAAQNSEAKHSSLVPVDHTFRKHVRKPRGSAPGFVTYRNEKTIDVNPKAK